MDASSAELRRKIKEQNARDYANMIKHAQQNAGKYQFPENAAYQVYDPGNFADYVEKSLIPNDEKMNLLAEIILNHKKDIKKNREQTTKTGAEAFVNRRNKDKPADKHWQIKTDDLNNDGIRDIAILDEHGRFKYIDGYSLSSQDPLKKYYIEHLQNNYGTPKERKWKRLLNIDIPDYQNWKKKGLKVYYDNNLPFNAPTWSNKTEEGQIAQRIIDYNDQHYKQTGVKHLYRDPRPRKRTALAIFSSYLVKPNYTAALEKFPEESRSTIKKIAPFIEISARCYKLFVSNIVYNDLGGTDEDMRHEKKAKAPNDDTLWSAKCKQLVSWYLNNQEKIKNDMIAMITTFITQNIYEFNNQDAKFTAKNPQLITDLSGVIAKRYDQDDIQKAYKEAQKIQINTNVDYINRYFQPQFQVKQEIEPTAMSQPEILEA